MPGTLPLLHVKGQQPQVEVPPDFVQSPNAAHEHLSTLPSKVSSINTGVGCSIGQVGHRLTFHTQEVRIPGLVLLLLPANLDQWPLDVVVDYFCPASSYLYLYVFWYPAIPSFTFFNRLGLLSVLNMKNLYIGVDLMVWVYSSPIGSTRPSQ